MLLDSISVSRAPRSAIGRLPLLPRLGFVLDWAGRRVSIRHGSIVEALLAARRAQRGLTVKSFVASAITALNEIQLEALSLGGVTARAPAAKKARAGGKASAKRKPAPRPKTARSRPAPAKKR